MNVLRMLVAGGVGLGLFGSSPTLAQEDVPGRLILELTDEGARALHGGRLDLPVPAGGESLNPEWRPLFRSRSGPLSRFALVTFDSRDGRGASNGEWLAALTASSLVKLGISDRAFRLSAFPDDPYLEGDGGVPPQLHLYNPGGLSLNATRAWPYIPARNGVVVAIIDSGVNWRHPDLGGLNPPGGVVWTNSAELAGSPGVDDDANGFIDDVVGWDFVEIDSVGPLPQGWNPAPGEDARTPDADPSDYAGHGTQVAGLVSAMHNNSVGLAAGAPGVQIMPLRVGWLGTSGNGFVFMSFCAQALEYAARNGAQVANCSWDSGNILGLGAAIDLAIDTFDMVVVGSAGNSGTNSTGIAYLAAREDCIGVGGILFSGLKAGPSNYGSWVDIAAFYEGMSSTFFDRGAMGSEYRLISSGGTSFAAPQVSALAALLRAVDPATSAATVRSVIGTTGMALTAMEPVWADSLGGGLANYRLAVTTLGGGWDRDSLGGSLASHGDAGETFFFLGQDTARVVGTTAGDAAMGWESGVPVGGNPAPGVLPLSATWDGVPAPLMIWGAGDSLWAIRVPGSPVAGWPQELPPGAGQPVAAPTAGGSGDRVYIPYQTGVRVLSPHPATGVEVSELGYPLWSLVSSGPDSAVLLAGIEAPGNLHVWEDGSAPVVSNLGTLSAAPVIGEFLFPGNPEVVTAGPDSLFPTTRQNVYFVGRDGLLSTTVGIIAPPITALSLTGFSRLGELQVVAVDEEGGIHLVNRAGSVQSLPGAGPVAGEVVSADVSGDYEADLVVLTLSGELHAYNAQGKLIAGFPRSLPHGAFEAPLILDAGSDRHIVVADTTGGIWSLPVARAGLPSPWPGYRGGPGRNAFLGHDRATPVEVSATLTWSWESGERGRLCWEIAAGDLAGLRVRQVQTGAVLWTGSMIQGCAELAALNGGDRLALEGLDRKAGWRGLAAVTLPARQGIRLNPPAPNPFRTLTSIAWEGAGESGRLVILDVQGRLVREDVLIGDSGAMAWDGTDDRGVARPPGIYFVRVRGAPGEAVRRVIKLR